MLTCVYDRSFVRRFPLICGHWCYSSSTDPAYEIMICLGFFNMVREIFLGPTRLSVRSLTKLTSALPHQTMSKLKRESILLILPWRRTIKSRLYRALIHRARQLLAPVISLSPHEQPETLPANSGWRHEPRPQGRHGSPRP